MLYAAHGLTAAYSVPTSRRGVVTIVDAAAQQQPQQPQHAPAPALATLSLLDQADARDAAAAVEMTVLALGPHVVARGSGSRVVYKVWRPPPKLAGQQQQLQLHDHQHDQPTQQWAMDYEGPVLDVHLSARYAAVLVAGPRAVVVLHSLSVTDAGAGDARGLQRRFDAGPEPEDRITSLALAEHFLVLGTDRGQLALFSLANWGWIVHGADRRPASSRDRPIRTIVPNAAGTRFIYTDATGAYLHDPLAERLDDRPESLDDDLPLPDFPLSKGAPPHILWDQTDPHVFMVHGGGQLHGYAYVARSTRGPHVTKLGAIETGPVDGGVRIQPMAYDFPAGFVPLVSRSGRLLSLSAPASSSASLSASRRPPVLKTFLAPVYQCLLECEPHLAADKGSTPDGALLQAAFNQSLALVRLQDAWRAALRLGDDARQAWLALGNKAVEMLDIGLAVRVYRRLGDAGMVLGLEPLLAVEDPRLLAGHAALLFGRHDEAERLFLASSRPAAAMEMRRDLLQCDRALQLVQLVAPGEVAATALQYGRQLELQGDDCEAALRMYEVAERRGDRDDKALAAACAMGRARCTLRLGHVREGVALALALDHGSLLRECAAILAENRATLVEAAALYERGGLPEMAARLYLQVPDLAQAARLMPRVALPRLHTLYARACEEAGRYPEAAVGYERARDLDSVVRLCLSDAYPQPERAFALVHATGSAAATMLAVAYCQRRGDVDGALRFLLLARQAEAAFEYAKAQQRVDAYVEAVGSSDGGGGGGLPEAEALRVAEYYEGRQELAAAARFYRRCQRHEHRAKALKLALQCGAVDLAIDIVVEARVGSLTTSLLHFLNGDSDGVHKDAHHLYRLHLALGNYDEAAKAADLHATQQQAAGEYGAAHATLHQAIRALEDAGASVPGPLRGHFYLLHAYALAKRLIQHDDHRSAARLLLRVARRIAAFPAHPVPILTSAVIECQRAGLAGQAFQYASLLVTDPAYREGLDPQVRRKFETIVRRGFGVAAEQEPEDEKDDGHDDDDAAASRPMCIASGRFMGQRSEEASTGEAGQAWCVCPNSRMPALLMEYRRFIDAEAAVAPDGVAMDPVCGEPIRKADLVRMSAAEVLKRW